MHDDGTVELQLLIDRMGQGDRSARRELLDRACSRLRRLAAHMLYTSFPVLQPRHEVDSVVHETWLRLAQALDSTDPPTVADFFRLAAHKIRQVLLDMIARQKRVAEHEVNGTGESSEFAASDRAELTYDPTRLAMWTEFHQKAAQLPEDERAIVELHYYLGIPQAEIARMLNLHPREVSRRWIAATDRLADDLGQSGISF